MSLVLNSAGGGSVTIQEPNTASNRVVSLPDADGALLADTSQTVQKLVSGSVSAAAQVDFVLTSYTNFSRFFLQFSGQGSATADLAIRVSVDGGANYISASSSYTSARLVGATHTSSSTGTYALVGSLTTFAYQHFGIHIFEPFSTTSRTYFSTLPALASSDLFSAACRRAGTPENNNAIRLFPSTGTFTGDYELYGIL